MLAYIPVFFLVELFKRTSSRKSKSERLQNIIQNMSKSENFKMEEIKIENGSSKNKNKKWILFPWWFKIIFYCISYTCMALSICSIIFIGIHLSLFLILSLLVNNFINNFLAIEFGNDNVRNWLISLVISFLIGMVVTLPLQVT
jgi:hypothetical protein